MAPFQEKLRMHPTPRTPVLAALAALRKAVPVQVPPLPNSICLAQTWSFMSSFLVPICGFQAL